MLRYLHILLSNNFVLTWSSEEKERATPILFFLEVIGEQEVVNFLIFVTKIDALEAQEKDKWLNNFLGTKNIHIRLTL